MARLTEKNVYGLWHVSTQIQEYLSEATLNESCDPQLKVAGDRNILLQRN